MQTIHQPVYSTGPALNPAAVAGLAGAKVFRTVEEMLACQRTLRAYGLANYFVTFKDVQGHGLSFGWAAR